MSDIVERLRSPEVFIDTGGLHSPVAHEAADTITRLTSEAAWARGAAEQAERQIEEAHKAIPAHCWRDPPKGRAWTIGEAITSLAAENEKLRSLTVVQESLIRKSEAANEKLRAALQWQPIETAPRDGTPVLVGWDTGWWDADKCHCEDGVWGYLNSDMSFTPFNEQPTHWLPLPPPPALKEKP
jgi:hypothetical protein